MDDDGLAEQSLNWDGPRQDGCNAVHFATETHHPKVVNKEDIIKRLTSKRLALDVSDNLTIQHI